MRYQIALLSLLWFLPSVALADSTAKDDRIKSHKDALVRDVTCGVVTEFAIRDVNLFIAQMDIINSDSGDKKWVTKEMVAVLDGYKLDLAYQVEELMRLGLDRSEIDRLIGNASINVHQRYFVFYMKSIDVDVAKIAIAATIEEQGRCSERFVKEVLPEMKSRRGDANG